ncbi:MAG: MBL fold metallo-hydrolase, partial [Myxococcales bacterium]|nr:MBL fold metallo-hydrolase [Myxococcales bacterium]
APALPPGLSLQWLGTSGFHFAYEGHSLLIDPYATRVPLGRVLGRTPVAPDRDRIARHLPRADVILIGHTHFDHAMDAPILAQRDRCEVLGSRSMACLMATQGLAAQAIEVEPYRVYERGPFRITFVPSAHSKLVLGWRVPSSGDITCEHVDGLACGAYRCGQVYGIHLEVAGARFYHQGSADLIEGAIRHRDVDFFLAGIAGRGFTRDYTARILGALRPRCVIPHHHDDFFRGLDEPMRFSFNVNLGAFVDEVAAVSRALPVVTLEPLQVVG